MRGIAVAAVLVLAACGRTGLIDVPTDAGAAVPDASVPGVQVDAGSANFTACMLIGGYDRLQVHGEWADPARCLWVTLVAPEQGGGPNHAIDLPTGWGVERMGFAAGTACPESPWSVEWAEPTFVSGEITFFSDAPNAYPQRISMGLEASFAPKEGVPETLAVEARGIPVTGECGR